MTFLTLLTLRLYGQTRTIVGRVLSEDLETLPVVEIHLMDTLLLGKTDFEGRFKIQIPQDAYKLIFSFIGMEWTTIQLNKTCDTNEVIMMYDGTYDFMSPEKIDKLRLKRFKKLSGLHLQAHKKGLFLEPSACYTRIFESNKAYYDKVKEDRKKKDIQTKLIFEKLTIGDTIKIPYNGQYRHDGTDRTTLFVYSNWTDRASYDCIIEGTIISKNKAKKGFNLVYKVTNCDLCKSQSIYNGKTMKVGETFEHNMRYYTILRE